MQWKPFSGMPAIVPGKARLRVGCAARAPCEPQGPVEPACALGRVPCAGGPGGSSSRRRKYADEGVTVVRRRGRRLGVVPLEDAELEVPAERPFGLRGGSHRAEAGLQEALALFTIAARRVVESSRRIGAPFVEKVLDLVPAPRLVRQQAALVRGALAPRVDGSRARGGARSAGEDEGGEAGARHRAACSVVGVERQGARSTTMPGRVELRRADAWPRRGPRRPSGVDDGRGRRAREGAIRRRLPARIHR